jgi:rubrerythrin
MDMRFSTQDTLQVAENVEQREIDFYLRASHGLEDQELKRLCGKLACWSLRHKKIWERKRQGLGPDQYATVEETVFSHPGAMAGLTWFGLRASSDARIKNWTCPNILLWEARQRANDLITFYEGLKGFVRDKQALMMVDRILRQEVRHFSYIERLLRSIPELKTFSSVSEP